MGLLNLSLAFTPIICIILMRKKETLSFVSFLGYYSLIIYSMLLTLGEGTPLYWRFIPLVLTTITLYVFWGATLYEAHSIISYKKGRIYAPRYAFILFRHTQKYTTVYKQSYGWLQGIGQDIDGYYYVSKDNHLMLDLYQWDGKAPIKGRKYLQTIIVGFLPAYIRYRKGVKENSLREFVEGLAREAINNPKQLLLGATP